ncbi:hypothetical protein CEXT_124411 [Caerostris extrusa]|uniref:Uncharacterized protein n=1 Tax=Caerostris extrusa TaxID=172846 RepID=A0AAV4RR17_CAEEX|nr:hypothetical protein CEXT_124411 [Caerostris extrusa]
MEHPEHYLIRGDGQLGHFLRPRHRMGGLTEDLRIERVVNDKTSWVSEIVVNCCAHHGKHMVSFRFCLLDDHGGKMRHLDCLPLPSNASPPLSMQLINLCYASAS